MIPPELIVAVIILGAVILFSFEIFSIDVTALIIMCALMVTGVLTVEEAVSGFSNPATLTVLAMLIISVGIQNTGLINYFGKQSASTGINNEIVVMAMTMFLAGTLSAFLNNTAVVAIFLPMTLKIAKQKKINANKLLMALSFGAMLGGSCTVIGSSTNLLVSAISEEHGLGAIKMFELAPVGGILFIAVTIFLVIGIRKTIPERKSENEDLTGVYRLDNYLAEMKLPENSPFVGKTIEQTRLLQDHDLEILQIIRKEKIIYLPENIQLLEADDSLIVKAKARKIVALGKIPGIEIRTDLAISDQELITEDVVLMEVIIGPDSQFINKRINEIDFRKKYSAIPLAVRGKQGVAVEQLDQIALSEGFALLLEIEKDAISELHAGDDFIVLHELQQIKLEKRKAIIATAIVIAVILAATLNLTSILVSAWLGCVAMFVTRVIRIQNAYSKVSWKIFFLLAGLIPLGTAIEKSGTGHLVATFITEHLAIYGPVVILSSLFLLTTLLSGFVTNNAVAVLLAPIAITIAHQLQIDSKPFLLAVIFGANTSFLTPIGYQTNTLIYGAGQFKFVDFLKTGGLMTLLVWILITVLLPLFYF